MSNATALEAAAAAVTVERLRGMRAELADLGATLAALIAEADRAIERYSGRAGGEHAGAVVDPVTTCSDPAPGAPAPIDLAAAVADAVAASEQLTLIRGVDATAAALLNALGVCRFAEIAALTAEDVAEISAALGEPGRISREGWIEQASLLARGVTTAYAGRQRHAGATPSIWDMPHRPHLPLSLLVAEFSPDATSRAPLPPPLPTAARITSDIQRGAAVAAPAVNAATVVDLDAARAARRGRRQPAVRSGLARAVAVTAMALTALAAWTGIELADRNWDARAALFGQTVATPVASLR